MRIIQRQLSRIAKDYPFFGKPTVNGIFDADHRKCGEGIPEALQPDRRTAWWASPPGIKISYIYVSVKDLAELTSEGETADGTQQSPAAPGPAPPCAAADTGTNVEQVQFWLSDPGGV